MMGWHGNGMGSIQWLSMGVLWLILIGVVVWLVVLLLPVSSGGASRSAGEPDLNILDRRLAIGAIDLDTWQAQRAALKGAQQDKRPAS